MFLRQPIIANDYFMIITIIGPTINRSDASLKSNAMGFQLLLSSLQVRLVEKVSTSRSPQLYLSFVKLSEMLRQGGVDKKPPAVFVAVSGGKAV